MQFTPNYNLPIYEASDIANYLDTYNNTITEIDTAIHNVQTKAENGELHGEELDREIKTLTSRVSELETSLSSTIENLSTLSTTVSAHTNEIAKVKEDLLAQNTAVKTLSNNLTDLGTRFMAFATGQEHFNNEISARVGNRFFKTYTYSIPPSTKKEQYKADFTIETGLANDENFTKSHVMLDFMQTMADQKMSSCILNSAFSTTGNTYNQTVDGIQYTIYINFNSSTGSIRIRIMGQKQEITGVLYANAIVYTD
jgi:hypothetical protein